MEHAKTDPETVPLAPLELTDSEALLFDILKAACFKIGEQPSRLPDLFGDTDTPCYVMIAGGWVRDKRMKVVSKDFDLIVPFKMAKMVWANIRTVIELNKKLQLKVEYVRDIILQGGKCKDQFLQKVKFELKYTSPSEKEPIVEVYELDIRENKAGETYKEDVKTRDFTINSAYFNILINEFMVLNTALEDIDSRTLRCVCSFDDTFLCDPSRLLRAVRFEVSKNMRMTPELDLYLKQNAYDIIVNFRFIEE